MRHFLTKSVAALSFSTAIFGAAAWAQSSQALCATDAQKAEIAEAVTARSGAPTPIYARNLSLPELTVASGLPDTIKSYGVEAPPERMKAIWSSIDEWGAETKTHMVFTMGGDHVADFVSLVPITQPDDGSGFIDAYADEGRGVHGHIFLDLVKSVYAAELPGDDGVTRMVSLYNEEGGLILGMYASITGKAFDQRAVDGFDRTMKALQDYPSLCD